MDSDDEHDHDEGGGGDSSPKASASLTGFLFGNIDKEGKLENDVLDEVKFEYEIHESDIHSLDHPMRQDQFICSQKHQNSEPIL